MFGGGTPPPHTLQCDLFYIIDILGFHSVCYFEIRFLAKHCQISLAPGGVGGTSVFYGKCKIAVDNSGVIFSCIVAGSESMKEK